MAALSEDSILRLCQNYTIDCTVLVIVVVLWYTICAPRLELLRNVPVAMGSSKTLIGAKYAFISNSKEVIANGMAQFRGPFQILTPLGPRIILPHKYIEEVKSHPHLSISEALTDQMFGHLDGFTVFKEMNPHNSIMQLAIRKKLSPASNIMVENLSDEAYKSLADVFGSSPEWQPASLIDQARKVTGRVTTRALLGPELCSNPEWQEIVAKKDQEINAALFALHAWPAVLRPIVNKLSPVVRRYHGTTAKARDLIDALAHHRRKQYRELKSSGQPLPNLGDNIVWMDELSRGNTYDLAGAQLFMSLAASPTSDVLTNFVYELGAHPQYFDPLREEIRKEFKGRWDKPFLDRLTLMDSVLKEVMRMNPLATIALQRKATRGITFKDGSTIPRGAATVLSMEIMRDPEVFSNPDEFNPYRFLHGAGQDSKGGDSKWSTPDPYYLAFGYGKHACPGRWLANNQVKVTVCHLVMMYDWKFAGASKKPKVVTIGFMNKKDLDARVLYRRRQDDWAPVSP